jgi:hypothetical protein
MDPEKTGEAAFLSSPADTRERLRKRHLSAVRRVIREIPVRRLYELEKRIRQSFPERETGWRWR